MHYSTYTPTTFLFYLKLLFSGTISCHINKMFSNVWSPTWTLSQVNERKITGLVPKVTQRLTRTVFLKRSQLRFKLLSLYVIVPGYCWRNTTRSQFKCFPALHSTWLPVAKTESSIIVWCGNIGLRLRCLYLKISQIFFEFYEMCNQIDIFCMHPLHMVEAISQLVYAKFEKSWVFGVRTLNNISKA